MKNVEVRASGIFLRQNQCSEGLMDCGPEYEENIGHAAQFWEIYHFEIVKTECKNNNYEKNFICTES